MQTKKNLYCNFITLAIIFIYLFLHLYKLPELPFAINVDEAGLWYNVQCLLNYGIDQGNNSWPLLFTNFYGEQSAMYTYLALICVKLFGNTLFAIRLPAVFNACLIFVFGYKIINKLYNNDKINLLFCILCTICPYFIINCRIALDCNLMLGFSTMFLWFFIKAIDSKKLLDTIIAGFTCGLVLYTYAISYIAIPMFSILACIYLLYFKKISWKQILGFAIPLISLGFPLFIIQIINIFNMEELVIGSITLPKFNYSRHGTIGFEYIIAHIILFSKYIFMGSEVALLTSSFCSNFYLISIPFLILGIIQTVKIFISKEFTVKSLLLMWSISVFITLLSIKNGIRDYQANAIMFVCLIFIIEGLIYSFSKVKHKKMKQVLVILFLVLYVFSFCMFSYHYFNGDYNENVYIYERADADITEVLEYVEDKQTYIAIKPVYYKIATQDNPIIHPFEYEIIYDESGQFIEFKDIVPPYGNIICDRYGEFLNDINEDFIYVIPQKEVLFIQKMDSYKQFTKTKLGHYFIYECKREIIN